MTPSAKFQSNSRTLLVLLLVLLGLGGIGGGVGIFIDTSGVFMGLPPELLNGFPISNFLLPGVFLVTVMGVIPIVIAWGLRNQATWAWLAAVVQSIVIILWICFQIYLWKNPIAIQWVYLIWGLAMLGLCFRPGLKSDMRRIT